MRFGLIGTGFWADVCHAAALAATEGVEFVGVWGRNADAAAALAGKHGVRAFADPDELMAEVDGLSFAVPPDVQAPIAIRAAAAGKHLLLEKPIALALSDADALVEAAERGGAATLVFVTNRFMPAIADWVEEAGRHEWRGATGNWICSPLSDPGGDFARSDWRWARGALWDVGPHALSLILPLMGEVEAIEAVAGTGDLVALTLRHRGGGLTTLSMTLRAPQGADLTELRLWGGAGVTSKPDGDQRANETLSIALTELVRLAGAADKRHPCDVRFGREIVRILETAERSLTH
jgi:predicted dehydrogenase